MTEFTETIANHKIIWGKKAVVRKLYTYWYRKIISHIPDQSQGLHIEIGSGCGNFKKYFPQVLATDTVPNPWIDRLVDANASLPFEDNSVDTFILIDVVHHLSNPLGFFGQAAKKLKAGGRILILEPYVSAFSFIIYKFFHHEALDTRLRIPDLAKGTTTGENSAIPTILFEYELDTFLSLNPGLKLICKEYQDFLVYPLTGGFSGISVIPPALVSPLLNLEKPIVALLGRYIALRIFVVLEKR